MTCFLFVSGLFVKVHESRSLEQNRKLARKRLLDKLDEHLNGENSVSAQLLRIEEDKRRKAKSKAKKRQAMKESWKLSNEGRAEEDENSSR